MKKHLIYNVLVFACLFSLISCENESTNEAQVVYLPMSVGNYWIYQHYKIDPLGDVEITRPNQVWPIDIKFRL